jgi:ferredoxin-NADP reductase
LDFDQPEWISGLWVGGHFFFHLNIDGQLVSRKYTPITPVNTKGFAQFVIKIYRDPHPDFPNGGKFTRHLEQNVKVGDSMMVEGPIGKLKYLGAGNFQIMKKQLANKT